VKLWPGVPTISNSMKRLEHTIAAALYDTIRQMMPSICAQVGKEVIHLKHWDYIPGETQQLFIDFSKGFLDGVKSASS